MDGINLDRNYQTAREIKIMPLYKDGPGTALKVCDNSFKLQQIGGEFIKVMNSDDSPTLKLSSYFGETRNHFDRTEFLKATPDESIEDNAKSTLHIPDF